MVFHDERTSQTPHMEHALELNGAIVPALWMYEVENVLLIAQRAGRIDHAKASAVMATARVAGITVDPIGPDLRFGAEFRLARTYNLTIYDAMYLELAQRENLPLMTLDGTLKAAAESLGLAWQKAYSLALPSPTRRKKRK